MKRFDFLIVPVYRSGGTAIQSFISAHPGIVAIPKWSLDHCLEENREQELLESFQDLMLANPDARVGLVQHRYIGEHEDLDSIAARLSKIVRNDGLILVVRNQFEALLSGMNHRRIALYCDYSFSKAGLYWPERVKLGRTSRDFFDEVESATSVPDDPKERISEEAAFTSDEALDYVRYARIQETYERHFSRPAVFDYDDLLCADNRNAMRMLFDALKTDTDFYLPFFATAQAGTHDRFLSHNGIKIFSEHIPERTVVLRPVTKNEHSVFDKGTPIGRVYNSHVRELFGEELCLVTAPPLQASEIAKRQIDAFLRGFFYPLWRNNHEIATRAIDGFRTMNLSSEQESSIARRLSVDAAHFFEMNSGLGKNWRWTDASAQTKYRAHG